MLGFLEPTLQSDGRKQHLHCHAAHSPDSALRLGCARCHVLFRGKMAPDLQVCVNIAAWQGLGGQGSPVQAAAVMYGASPSWPLAHLPNAAAHGPASTALGDSWKAHHHSAAHHPARPAKLLLAGESASSSCWPLSCQRQLHVPDAQAFASSRSALLLADHNGLRVWHFNSTIKVWGRRRMRHTRSLNAVKSGSVIPACVVDLRTATPEVPLAARFHRGRSCVLGGHPSRNAGSSEHATRRAAGQRRWLRGRSESHGHSAHGPAAHAAAGAPGEGGAVPAAGASRRTSQPSFLEAMGALRASGIGIASDPPSEVRDHAAATGQVIAPENLPAPQGMVGWRSTSSSFPVPSSPRCVRR